MAGKCYDTGLSSRAQNVSCSNFGKAQVVSNTASRLKPGHSATSPPAQTQTGKNRKMIASRPMIKASAIEAVAPPPKLTLRRHPTFSHHRSGWAYALDALTPLLRPDGVVLDSFMEETFCWELRENERSGKLPYRDNWVAFIHNPPGIPKWHQYKAAPQEILELPAWRQSRPHCRGIFTFSADMCSWLRQRIDVPVSLVVHPAEPVDRCFSMEKFFANPVRRIIQIGAWLRRLHSIALLKVKMQKTLLSPRPAPDRRLQLLLEREAQHDSAARNADWSSVEFLAYQSASGYDQLLAQNIVFLDLYDTVVNNTVLECIVRRTPVLCNRLPALEELLGPDYPFFFSGLAEAAAKAENPVFIERAHQHLMAIPQDRFSQRSFRDSVANSAIYRDL
jgi:hypothetical protein